MSNNEWYGADSWYTPLKKEEPLKKAPERHKRGAFWWISVIAALAIIAAAVWLGFFADSEYFQEPELVPLPEQEMPENWKDFFSNYYTTVEGQKTEIKLERAEYRDSFEVTLNSAAAEDKSLQSIYESCSKSIVAIMGYVTDMDGYYWGSGIILSSDGLILTNTHVIEKCETATVTLYDDSVYEAKLVGADSTSDIALLKIEAENLPAAEFGDSSELIVGEHVAAIGNPLGETFRMTMTDGIVSAIDRGIDYNGHSLALIQTNTAINEGNSGGALFNMSGQVVGITNMKMMSAYSSIEGIGFAIPTSTVRSVVASLLKYGEVRGRPALGITVGALPKSAIERYQLPEGLYVSAVADGSDAKKKGIVVGDIIIEVNGKPAETTLDIMEVKNSLNVGDSIRFKIWRDGEVFEADIILVDTNNVY